MLIADTTFTAIDFESAGTAPGKTDTPVQIGTCTWQQHLGYSDKWMSYIHTDQKITWAAQKVHGITHNDLQNAPKFFQLWPSIKSKLKNTAVVAHGHGTEKRFLHAFPGHGFGPWIDTLPLARAAYPDAPSHSLGELCEMLELKPRVTQLVPNRDWHDALYDAVASMVLLEHIIQQFFLADKEIDLLIHPDTSAWHKLRH